MRILLCLVSLVSAGAALALSPIEKAQWKAIEGEYVIKFKKDFIATQTLDKFGLKSKSFVHKPSNVQLVKVQSISKVKSQLPVAEEISSKGIAVEMIRTLEALPNVEFVEPNYIYELYDATSKPLASLPPSTSARPLGLTPNDEFYSKLWGMDYIQGPEVWQDAAGGEDRDVVVAIFDTGITESHPDLATNIWRAKTNAGDEIYGLNAFDYTQPPVDEHGHGTHVAGTIGAVGNNETGVAGVNWNVKMLSVKIFEGSSARFIGMAGVVEALDWTTDLGVDLSSHSWGGGAYSEALYEAIGRANDAGIPFVAAAGNSYGDNDESPQYPASYDHANIISVAAIDPEGKKAPFSNWGINTVDIAAPGVDIYSTYINGGYTEMSGTSMATPHVSGALALMLSQDYWMYGDEAKERLLNTAVANEHMEPLIGDAGATLNLYTLINNVER